MNSSNFSNSRRNSSQSIFTRQNRVVSGSQPPPLRYMYSDINEYKQQSHHSINDVYGNSK